MNKEEKQEISRKWRKCWRKEPYSKRKADNVVFNMIYRGKAKGNELYAYLCEYCQKYHVGRR